MRNNKKRINTEVSETAKSQWDNYMLLKHGTIKGPYGPELELAMLNHINNYTITNKDDKIKHGKITIDALKSICLGFKELPTFPVVQPIILKAMIQKYSNVSDIRPIKKYQKIVLSYSKEEIIKDEIFPQINIEGFCVYVDKLTQENLLKS